MALLQMDALENVTKTETDDGLNIRTYLQRQPENYTQRLQVQLWRLGIVIQHFVYTSQLDDVAGVSTERGTVRIQ
jgi:hypothetical protein